MRVVHTVETRAILELVFHEFDEKELLRAEFLWRPWTFLFSSDFTILLRKSSSSFWCKPTPKVINFSTSNLEANYEIRIKTHTWITPLDAPRWDLH